MQCGVLGPQSGTGQCVSVCGHCQPLLLLISISWMIDPYWTFVPVLLGSFFNWHSATSFNVTRSTVRQLRSLPDWNWTAVVPLATSSPSPSLSFGPRVSRTSVRSGGHPRQHTHSWLLLSYFRREEWQFGTLRCASLVDGLLTHLLPQEHARTGASPTCESASGATGGGSASSPPTSRSTGCSSRPACRSGPCTRTTRLLAHGTLLPSW